MVCNLVGCQRAGWLVPGDDPVQVSKQGPRCQGNIRSITEDTGIDPFLDHIPPEFFETIAARDMPGAILGLERAMFQQKDRNDITPVRQCTQVHPASLVNLLLGRDFLLDHLGDTFSDQIQGLVEQFQQDLLLAGNMVVEAGFLQVDTISDILHRGSMETFLTNDLGCNFQDLIFVHGMSYRPVGR